MSNLLCFTMIERSCMYVASTLTCASAVRTSVRATARLQGGVKESESEDNSSWMHWQHTQQLIFWIMVRVWWSCDKAGYEWQTAGSGLRWLQVCAWHDRSYIAGIPLLAHGLTVMLSPCPCSRSSPAGRKAACLCGHSKCKSATHSGLPPGWFSIF